MDTTNHEQKTAIRSELHIKKRKHFKVYGLQIPEDTVNRAIVKEYVPNSSF